MALPQSVIKRDHDLEQDFNAAGSELMEHRWHWTLDESNPKRVSISEYARAVERTQKTISIDAKAWFEVMAEDRQGSSLTGSDQSVTRKKTPNEHREKAIMGAERHHAAEAIARATGNAITTVSRTKREEITAVVGRARERAAERGTSVEEEIDRAAQASARGAAAEAKNRAERKARHTARYIEIEGDLGVAMKRLRKVLDTGEGVGFTAEETDLISEALGKLRAVVNLIDMRITGTTNIDWDSELAKISEAS